ncbi:MAG: beta-lactamase family protein [Bacteroidales bacterium]|nr:beta-lactamase family protein [Bacteroidales bacterium]
MKMSTTLAVAALSLALFSCKQEMLPNSEIANTESGRTVRFSVQAAVQSLEDDNTKTTFDGQTLVWKGDETMDVMFGNSSSKQSDASSWQSGLLNNNGHNVFTGEFTLNTDKFSEDDMQAVTVPGGVGSCAVMNGSNFISQFFISDHQVQESDNVMNGDNFPLYAFLDDAARTAAKQSDGSYVISGLQMKWGCGVVRFNVYGTHPSMDASEKVQSVKIYAPYGITNSSMIRISADNSLYNTKHRVMQVSLSTPAPVNGKTASDGVKLFLAIPARTGNTAIEKIEVETDKAVYIKDIDAISWSTSTNHRGKVYQYGLNLSKFKRMDKEDLSYFSGKVQSIIRRAELPSMQVCWTKGDDIITLTEVNEDFYAKTGVKAEYYPLSSISLYQACSMSKPPLSYVAMKLVDEGRLDLTQPVYEYYPEMLNLFADDDSKEHAKEITAYDILVHITGLDNSTYSGITYSGVTGVYKYSGPAIHILDLALGEIIGKDLKDYSKDYIFDKIGMKHSNYFWQTEYDLLGAVGHREGEGGTWGRSESWSASNAAYTLRTTAEEYTKYIRWTMAGSDLTPASHNQIFTDYFATSAGKTWQGLIWRHDTHSVLGDIYHHRGNNGNFKGWMCFVPDSDQTLIFLTNGTNSYNFYQPMAKLFLGTAIDIYALQGVGGALPAEDDGSPDSKITDPGRSGNTTW